MAEKPHILVVEDDPNALASLCDVLSSIGEIVGFSDGEKAVKYLQENSPSLIITDLVLPGRIDGLGILRWATENLPDTPVILITGHASIETAIEAMREGAYDYLAKPVDIRRFKALVQKALERYSLATEKRRLKEALESSDAFCGIVGVSPAMRQVFKLISAVAPTNTTVLITGESGTGKELVADAIHTLSGRKGKMVKINCSAIPDNLLESEIFGYEKGAFTGATQRKQGKFELADGGTLFLDEVGDIPLSLQAKLLRSLETSEVEPLGSNEVRKVDVRVIAATNQNLEKLVQEGKFRNDLYFRLRVFLIDIPPLRERHEDIPPLVSFFLKQISVKLGKPIKSVAPNVMQQLIKHNFPGNARQLKNMLEESAIIADGDTIRSLPSHTLDIDELQAPFGKIAEMERNAIIWALKKTNHNKAKAAKLLGIGLRTLYRKLKRYKINDL